MKWMFLNRAACVLTVAVTWVGCGDHTEVAGEALASEDLEQVLQIAADHEGNVYAARPGLHQIQKFNSAGRALPHLETYEPVTSLTMYVKEGFELTE